MPDREAFEAARKKVIGVDRQRLGIGTLSENRSARRTKPLRTLLPTWSRAVSPLSGNSRKSESTKNASAFYRNSFNRKTKK